MNSAALAPHLFRLFAGLIVMIPAYAVLHRDGVLPFAPDAEGLGVIITLMGSIYAVIFAFVIFVIWGQFTEVETLTARECSSLDDLLRFAQSLHPDSNRAIRRAVAEYAQRVANSEWHSLGEQHRDQPTEKAFDAVVSAAIRTAAMNPSEEPILQRVIDIARKCGEQRDERVSRSLTRIPPTLLALVRLIAVSLLLLVFLYPFHTIAPGMLSFALLAAILFLSNLVMTDTDNPFDGIFNVRAQPFLELTR
ncbi:MAG: DUF4239 domain-containing protein [Acidobacteriia bacterium]|nr:DUF4239 domain-containing protein [Terriglobia bacterium]